LRERIEVRGTLPRTFFHPHPDPVKGEGFYGDSLQRARELMETAAGGTGKRLLHGRERLIGKEKKEKKEKRRKFPRCPPL